MGLKALPQLGVFGGHPPSRSTPAQKTLLLQETGTGSKYYVRRPSTEIRTPGIPATEKGFLRVLWDKPGVDIKHLILINCLSIVSQGPRCVSLEVLMLNY